MTELSIPPTEIKYHKRSRELEVRFADGMSGRLSAEYLRVQSPSAEVKGHSAGEGVLVTGKEQVGITRIDPVGRLARRLRSTAKTAHAQAYEDLFWALLNSSEMALQH